MRGEPSGLAGIREIDGGLQGATVALRLDFLRFRRLVAVSVRGGVFGQQRPAANRPLNESAAASVALQIELVFGAVRTIGTLERTNVDLRGSGRDRFATILAIGTNFEGHRCLRVVRVESGLSIQRVTRLVDGCLMPQCGARESENTMTVSVFVGASVDGFIARPNGELDWLPEGGGEPHGYNEFFASVDALVIGRKTFETVLAFDAWPYGDKRVVVLSSGPVDLSGARGVVEQMAGDPADIVAKLAASGAHHLYVDGGITIQRFLRAGLVQRLVITRVPVLIGEGVPLFGSLPKDVRLRHVATRDFPSGLVQSEYRIES